MHFASPPQNGQVLSCSVIATAPFLFFVLNKRNHATDKGGQTQKFKHFLSFPKKNADSQQASDGFPLIRFCLFGGNRRLKRRGFLVLALQNSLPYSPYIRQNPQCRTIQCSTVVPDSFLSLSGGRVLFDIRRRPKRAGRYYFVIPCLFLISHGQRRFIPHIQRQPVIQGDSLRVTNPFCVFFYFANTLFLLTKGLDLQIPAH